VSTYYVRGATGSNSNTGTGPGTGSAWATFAKPFTSGSGVVGGDTVVIAPGVYREQVTVTITPASTVTVIGDYTASQFSDLDGGEVRLTAWTTNDTTAPTNAPVLHLNGKSFLAFSGITFVAAPAGATGGIYGAASHDLTFTRCTVIGAAASYNPFNLLPPADAAANILLDGCLVVAGSSCSGIALAPATSATADYSLASTIRNTVVLAGGLSECISLQHTGAGAFSGGGVLVDHCTLLGGSYGVRFSQATNANMRYPVVVTHGVFLGNGNSAILHGTGSPVLGALVQDFNYLYGGAAGGVFTGAGTIDGGYAPLLSFGQEWLSGLRPRPFLSPLAGAPQLGFANTRLAYGEAGTTASDATVGTVAWTNPGNAVLSDNVYAVATSIPASTGVSQYLKLTNWGFSLPASAVVDGVRCDWERKAQAASSLKTNSIKLVKAGAIAGTEQLGGDTGFYTTADVTFSHGGSTSLWGTTWTDAEVNASGFGVVISVKNLHATVACTASIDFVRLIVAYHTADGLGQQTVDFLNNPRPAGAASTANAVGALERGSSGVKDSSVYHTAAPSFRLDGPGYDDRALAVDATATTVTVWVRQNASYTGTKPRLQVRDGEECGVTAASVTGTAAVSTWEQLSLTFTPTRAGVVTIRVLSSTTAAAGSVNYDDFAVA
jgi:hypothetical protein